LFHSFPTPPPLLPPALSLPSQKPGTGGSQVLKGGLGAN